MPAATERERLHAARCRWLCTVLYLGGLRAAEVTGTPMGSFFCRRDEKGVERWWLEATGTGNKTRLVPATDELIAELARYRRAHALPPTPQPGEMRPLVLQVIGRRNHEKALSRGALHLTLKEGFSMAAERLRAIQVLRGLPAAGRAGTFRQVVQGQQLAQSRHPAWRSFAGPCPAAGLP